MKGTCFFLKVASYFLNNIRPLSKQRMRSKRCLSLLETLIVLVLLALVMGWLGPFLKVQWSEWHFQKEVRHFFTTCQKLQTAAMVFQSDIAVDLTVRQKALNLVQHISYPQSFIRNDQVVIFPSIYSLRADGREVPHAKLIFFPSGRISPYKQLELSCGSLNRWIDLQGLDLRIFAESPPCPERDCVPQYPASHRIDQK